MLLNFKGRGRGGGGHKGQRRHFTNPDQLAHTEEKKEKERQWRVCLLPILNFLHILKFLLGVHIMLP